MHRQKIPAETVESRVYFQAPPGRTSTPYNTHNTNARTASDAGSSVVEERENNNLRRKMGPGIEEDTENVYCEVVFPGGVRLSGFY